jgi:hypothetical protein
MTFPLAWAERLYGLILLTYPREFRNAYENEMRLVFRELLNDPTVGWMQLMGLMLRDLGPGIASPERVPSRELVVRSAMYGLLVVGFAIVARAFHPGLYVGFSVVSIPFIAYIPAAFWGARMTGRFSDGMWVCVVMGLVSSTMVLWDKLLFNNFPFYDAMSFIFSMLMGAAFCIVPAMIGSVAGAASSPVRAPRT